MKLKNCPFCKKNKVQVRDKGYWLVNCYNGECPVMPEVLAKTKKMAVDCWNGKIVYGDGRVQMGMVAYKNLVDILRECSNTRRMR